jgi:hypothetical protein
MGILASTTRIHPANPMTGRKSIWAVLLLGVLPVLLLLGLVA